MKTLRHLKKAILTTTLTLTPLFVFAKGGTGPGGGVDIAAHFVEVSKNAYKKLARTCVSPQNQDEVENCPYVRLLADGIAKAKVIPFARDTIKGAGGNPRDGGNDGQETIYLDVDRWSDKQNQQDPSKVLDARQGQILLSIHEPLVLAGAEPNDKYDASLALLGILKDNGYDLNALVGKPFVVAVAKNEVRTKTILVSDTVWASWYGNDPAEARLNCETKCRDKGGTLGREVLRGSGIGLTNSSAKITMECHIPLED